MTHPTHTRPIDGLLAEYVSGNLTKPAKALVDAHLELSSKNHAWVTALEEAAGCSLEMSECETLDDKAAMLDAIFANGPDLNNPTDKTTLSAPVSSLPASLHDFIGTEFDEIPWRLKLPGIRVYKMDEVEECEINMVRIKPGLAIPVHTHEGRELTLVLQGAFEDGQGHYQRGDIAIADETIDHKPVATGDEDCICFIVADAPPRFTGPLARAFSTLRMN